MPRKQFGRRIILNKEKLSMLRQIASQLQTENGLFAYRWWLTPFAGATLCPALPQLYHKYCAPRTNGHCRFDLSRRFQPQRLLDAVADLLLLLVVLYTMHTKYSCTGSPSWKWSSTIQGILINDVLLIKMHPKKNCTHILGVSKIGFKDGLCFGMLVFPNESYMVGIVLWQGF